MSDVAAVPTPPVKPMLAKLVRELPRGDGMLYEPKWDGLRCLVSRNTVGVFLQSRNGKPLARYFPEIVTALGRLPGAPFVCDGEIILSGDAGFSTLLDRLHPAVSRVERLARQSPATFVAFDVLAMDGHAVMAQPFEARRRYVEQLIGSATDHVDLTPITHDPEKASAWLAAATAGIDGVMAKPGGVRYQPGKRAMLKVKLRRTADCAVAGFRWHDDEPVVGSLLLGLYDRTGTPPILRHVGITPNLRRDQREALANAVRPYMTDLHGHPWEHGFNLKVSAVGRLPGAVSRWQPDRPLSWVPLRPELVAEITYDHLEGDRFRHAPRFMHLRPDRDATSCTYEQFAGA